jgi:hypothetical protein
MQASAEKQQVRKIVPLRPNQLLNGMVNLQEVSHLFSDFCQITKGK